MLKILALSNVTIILTTFVNNTNNAHANNLAYYFYFKKAINAAVKIQESMFPGILMHPRYLGIKLFFSIKSRQILECI